MSVSPDSSVSNTSARSELPLFPFRGGIDPATMTAEQAEVLKSYYAACAALGGSRIESGGSEVSWVSVSSRARRRRRRNRRSVSRGSLATGPVAASAAAVPGVDVGVRPVAKVAAAAPEPVVEVDKGDCYLKAFKLAYADRVTAELGFAPTFEQILSQPAERFFFVMATMLPVTLVREGLYHLGGTGPSLTDTLVAMLPQLKEVRVGTVADALPATQIDPLLYKKCPRLHHRCGFTPADGAGSSSFGVLNCVLYNTPVECQVRLLPVELNPQLDNVVEFSVSSGDHVVYLARQWMAVQCDQGYVKEGHAGWTRGVVATAPGTYQFMVSRQSVLTQLYKAVVPAATVCSGLPLSLALATAMHLWPGLIELSATSRYLTAQVHDWRKHNVFVSQPDRRLAQLMGVDVELRAQLAHFVGLAGLVSSTGVEMRNPAGMSAVDLDTYGSLVRLGRASMVLWLQLYVYEWARSERQVSDAQVDVMSTVTLARALESTGATLALVGPSQIHMRDAAKAKHFLACVGRVMTRCTDLSYLDAWFTHVGFARRLEEMFADD